MYGGPGNDGLINCGRPIGNWPVLYAQRVGMWEVGALVLFGKCEDFVLVIFKMSLSHPIFPGICLDGPRFFSARVLFIFTIFEICRSLEVLTVRDGLWL